MNLAQEFQKLRQRKKYPSDKLLLKNWSKLSELVLKLTPSCNASLGIRARIELLEMDCNAVPKCAVCHLECLWIPKRGWRKTCGSKTCAVSFGTTTSSIEKRKETCLKNFGVENPGQLRKVLKQPKQADPIQTAIKRKKTCLERFGTESYFISEDFKAKAKNTLQLRYGVEHPMQSEQVKSKHQETCLKNFGVCHPSQSKEVRIRTIATLQKRYGIENPGQFQEFIEKREQTNLKKFGFRYPLQSDEGKLASRKTVLAKYGDHPSRLFRNLRLARLRFYDQDTLEKLNSEDFWRVEYVEKQKSITQIGLELGLTDSPLLKYFHRFGIQLRNFGSSEELQFRSFLEQLLKEKVASATFGIIASKQKLLSLLARHSVDVYIPELKLAFEYNGVYWHSEQFKAWDFHLNKTLECERLGVRLIHIWSDDWMLKRSLMERKIKALLGKEKEKVFARKCKIIIPTVEQKRSFYCENHIKGDGAGSVSYALQYEDQLVACITFKNMGSAVWDLNRFATAVSVPGGFSRLLEHFKSNNDWQRIYTYADRSWSQGNVYRKCGFELVAETAPTYHGIESSERKNHMHYTHLNLDKRFPNLKGTQFQIMDQAGILRIWDCGQLKFELLSK